MLMNKVKVCERCGKAAKYYVCVGDYDDDHGSGSIYELMCEACSNHHPWYKKTIEKYNEDKRIFHEERKARSKPRKVNDE